MDDETTIQTIAAALEVWFALLGRQFGPLSRPQRRIMRLVANQPEVRVGDLASSLGHSTAGATKMIDTLEKAGFVRRGRLPDTDQRQVYVVLTPAGAEAVREADLVFVAQVKRSLDALAPSERTALAHLLGRIRANS